ncbi:MAG TPA: hypothetical protein VK824_10250 [Planctomycetota bacterium]|nr:hypothetical protein [Planctomycetota bacterium]
MRLALAVAAIVCLVAVARLSVVSARQLASPYDLMYESPNLATIRAIRSGLSPYDPAVYAGVPFTLTPYTPLYFYALALLPEAPGRPFLVARLVSLTAIAACALVLACAARGAQTAAGAAQRTAARAGRAAPSGAPRPGDSLRTATAALVAVALFLISWPISAYAAYLRMDPMALALSALSVLALRQPTPRRVSLAAVLAVLAVACKQTYLAAGLAGTLYLLCRDRRLAWRFLAVAGGAGAALAALASLVWGRGFWFSILVLRSSPVRLDIFRSQAEPQLHAPVFVLALLGAAVALVLAWRRHGASLLGRSPAPAYLLCATAVLLATLGKEGSSALYFMELAFALPLWLIDAAPAALPAPRLRAAFLALLLACTGIDLATSADHATLHAFPPNSAEREGAWFAGVRAGLHRAGFDHPRVLNLGPPHYAYGIADDVCMNDVSTYDQAFEQGALDPRPLEQAIRARAYDVVLVSTFATPERIAGRPTGPAIEAVRATYRKLWQDDAYTFYGR